MVLKLAEGLKVHSTELVAQIFALLETDKMHSPQSVIKYIFNSST